MKKTAKPKVANKTLLDTRTTDSLPGRSEVQVRVIFHGLVVSAFKTNDDKNAYDSFEVGSLSPSPTNHKPKLII